MERLVDSLTDTGSEIAWNPEFLREGFAVEDTLRPDRLVFGVHSEWAEQQIRAAFAPVIEAGCPVVVTDFATAELVKVAANSFLATKISFINAMAEVCETTGADVTQLAEAIGYDARIGRRFLNAGLGFGGGCLPKDIRAFIARAGELGVDQAVSFLREVDAINLRRRARTVELGLDLLDGSYRGTRVAVLGVAFKPNSDDIRDSPALDVAASVARRGAQVICYDPQAGDKARAAHPELHVAYSLREAVANADLVMLLTEWAEFQAMEPERRRRAREPAQSRRRAQCAGSGGVARGGLDVSRARAAVGLSRTDGGGVAWAGSDESSSLGRLKSGAPGLRRLPDPAPSHLSWRQLGSPVRSHLALGGGVASWSAVARNSCSACSPSVGCGRAWSAPDRRRRGVAVGCVAVLGGGFAWVDFRRVVMRLPLLVRLRRARVKS